MRNLTIFEGPDCGGKTSIAKVYAAKTGAVYVHSGPYLNLDGGSLTKKYVEIMAPAIAGIHDVVMYRCWLSEEPYSKYYARENRLTKDDIKLLTGVAIFSNAACVICLPPKDVVIETFKRDFVARSEYLDTTDKLEGVYHHYMLMAMFAKSGLEQMVYNYTRYPNNHEACDFINSRRTGKK